MLEDKVAADESRRIAQHESVKTHIESEVNAEIEGRARNATEAQSARVGQVADEFRGRALDETLASEHQISRSRGAARTSQYVDYAFYVIYALLGMRFALALVGARSGSGFVQFINGITYPLYMPFRGIVDSPSAGGFTLAVPVGIAILVYMVLHTGVSAGLRLVANRRTAI